MKGNAPVLPSFSAFLVLKCSVFFLGQVQRCLGLQPKNSVEDFSDEVTSSHIYTQCWGCVCIHHAFILYSSVGAHSIHSLTLVLQLIKLIEVGSLFYFLCNFQEV